MLALNCRTWFMAVTIFALKKIRKIEDKVRGWNHEFEDADHDRHGGRIHPWKLRPDVVGRGLVVDRLRFIRRGRRTARHLGRLQGLPTLMSWLCGPDLERVAYVKHAFQSDGQNTTTLSASSVHAVSSSRRIVQNHEELHLVPPRPRAGCCVPLRRSSMPTATGCPAARHSGNPSSRRRALRP